MGSSAKLNPRLRSQIERTPDIAVRAAAAAMEAGADEIVAFMRSIAPVDSGTLRDSIHWTWGDAPAGALVIDEVRNGKNKGMQYAKLRITFYVDDEAIHARWLEFGTAPHMQSSSGRVHPGTPAQPFFYKTWREQKKGFMRGIKAAVRRAIKEALKNG